MNQIQRNAIIKWIKDWITRTWNDGDGSPDQKTQMFESFLQMIDEFEYQCKNAKFEHSSQYLYGNVDFNLQHYPARQNAISIALKHFNEPVLVAIVCPVKGIIAEKTIS